MTSNFLDKLARKGQQTPEPEDYRGENGALICGTCGQPKEVRMTLDGTGPRLLPISCDCQKAKEAADRDRTETAAFRDKLGRMWREDGLIAPPKITLDMDDRRDSGISAACRRYVANWDRMYEAGMGILFYGPVGTGKSFLSAAIANELIARRVPAAVVSLLRLTNLIWDSKDRQALIDRLQRYHLLVLDDVGSQRETPFVAEQLLNVTECRINSKLPLLVTTNLGLETLEKPGEMQDARTCSRILRMCQIRMPVTGGDRRVEEAEQLRQLARKILRGDNENG